tara:strand:+ start:180064 stop:181320 length:1257 start_codon:yes stop_codon:yes gene_type:complete
MFGFGKKNIDVKQGKVDRKKDYAWEGRNNKGRKISGITPAANAQEMNTILLQQNITPIKIKIKGNGLFSGGRKKKITSMDITLFTRQISTMIKSGVPLVRTLDIVAEGQDNESLKELILDLKNEISSGTDFTTALRKHPEHFDELYCNLVASAEQSGKMEDIFESIALYKEKTEAVKKKIKKAMTYPISVLVVAGIVTVILLLKVVPQFEEMFSNFGAELPKFTQMVLNLSNFMQNNWSTIFGILVVLVLAFKEAKKRSKKFNDFLEALSLKAPIIKGLVKRSAIARFTRTLSTTQASGVNLIEGLISGAGATGNSVYRDAIFRVREQVATGQALSFALQATALFPPMVVQMTEIGEESGNLEGMLSKVAILYEEEVDNAVENLTSLMEPMIMAFLGVVVGGLIIAMYLPVFKMGSAV